MRTTTVIAAALLTVMVSGCSSGRTTHTAAPPPSSAAAVPSPSAVAPSSAAPSPVPASPAPVSASPARVSASPSVARAGVPECTAGQLRVSEGEVQGAAGHIGVGVHLTNISSARCLVSAYPGVAGLDAAGHQVVQAVRTPRGMLGGLATATSIPPVVTLVPGGVATAVVEGSDVPVGTATACPPLAGLLVTPPGTRTATRLPAAPGDCNGLLVHPVVLGLDGQQTS